MNGAPFCVGRQKLWHRTALALSWEPTHFWLSALDQRGILRVSLKIGLSGPRHNDQQIENSTSGPSSAIFYGVAKAMRLEGPIVSCICAEVEANSVLAQCFALVPKRNTSRKWGIKNLKNSL